MPGFLQRLVVVVILLGTYTNFAVNIGVLLYGFFPLVAGNLLFVRHAPESPDRSGVAPFLSSTW
jgi:hypothetical protein